MIHGIEKEHGDDEEDQNSGGNEATKVQNKHGRRYNRNGNNSDIRWRPQK